MILKLILKVIGILIEKKNILIIRLIDCVSMFQQSYAYSFVKEQENSSYPFLMVIAPPAPHQPFTPEAKYSGFFEGMRVPRNIQFNFENNTVSYSIGTPGIL